MILVMRTALFTRAAERLHPAYGEQIRSRMRKDRADRWEGGAVGVASMGLLP